MRRKIIKLKESDIERLVTRIIKEEEGESDSNPMDVDKFLELADKYLFDRYSKYAEKIDTPVEKAKLIAALAQKWGISVDDLSRVKSVMSQKESVSKKKSRLDEIGYDDPSIMATHVSRIIAVLRGTYNDFSTVLEALTKDVTNPNVKKEDLLEGFDKLYKTIYIFKTAIKQILEEIEEKFTILLENFQTKIDTLRKLEMNYTEDDFNEVLSKIIHKLAEQAKPFGHSMINSIKRYYKIFQGKDRGTFGTAFNN
jgi:hypothetical protein